ncbi:hypothetical protein [Kitasatospora sp. CB01950]|uniref:hypothetical protein n=1 Tax=Kitasatospora sp. CB01950 TaxID=1703930 RepID=UPI00116146B9|nr:hypothetical protein [Kitasatospora sp. CB01950]
MAELIRSHAEDLDALEHVSVHRTVSAEVTVGVFTLAPSLLEAERRTGALVRRAVEGEPELAGFAVLSVGAALVPGPWWGFE